MIPGSRAREGLESEVGGRGECSIAYVPTNRGQDRVLERKAKEGETVVRVLHPSFSPRLLG